MAEPNSKVFNDHKNFRIETDHWGNASVDDLITVLECAIDELYSFLDGKVLPNKTVVVKHASTNNIKHPMLSQQTNEDTMFLAQANMVWSDFVFEFSHELCHHITDNDYDPNDRFGWLEESFCELSSLFVLRKMHKRWKANPPYKGWDEYADFFAGNAERLITDKANKLDEPFLTWLDKYLDLLYHERKSPLRMIVAIQLLPVFEATPDLWKCMQYYSQVKYTDSATLHEFIEQWKTTLPDYLKQPFEEIEKVLCKKL
jgi:hypothetical protein